MAQLAKGLGGAGLYPSLWPGLAVRRTASLPLAYARPSTSFLHGLPKTWMPATSAGMTTDRAGLAQRAAQLLRHLEQRGIVLHHPLGAVEGRHGGSRHAAAGG